MPSFDVVSEVDKHELTNAVDQANRELSTRFDFKGTDAKFELEGFVVNQVASSAFQLKQMLDILRSRLSARGIDTRCLGVSFAASGKLSISFAILSNPVLSFILNSLKLLLFKILSKISLAVW